MPYHQFALPVTATNLSIKHRNESYPLLLDTDTFDRAGEDGDIPILPINGGDEYVGEALEGHWHKGWNANIDTFCATIDSGLLRLTGVAKVAGVTGSGWISSHHPVPLLDELEYVFSTEVPIDDTGGTATRDIYLRHHIRQDKSEGSPIADDNFIEIHTFVDEGGLTLRLYKEINGVNTLLDSGYDYTMDGTKSTGALEACIWRVVFNGKPGTTGATMSVYLKQSDTLANAELATENELDGSPYDISDLAFNVGYPAYTISTQNTTYFGTTYDSANRAESTYLRLDYPSQFDVNYNYTVGNYGDTDVTLWDGDPDSGGIRVYDEDHVFANDPYLQNGLIQLHLNEGISNGFNLYGYIGAAWERLNTTFFPRLDDDNKNLQYPYLVNVIQCTPERVILKVKLCDTSANDDDYFVICYVTIKRGLCVLEYEPITIYPIQRIEAHYQQKITDTRFKYLGDCVICDQDIGIASTNNTLTDNFIQTLDYDGDTVIIGLSTNIEPTSYSAPGSAIRMNTIPPEDYVGTKYMFLVTPFALVANLFQEAEDATLVGGAALYFTDPAGAATNLRAQSANAGDIGQVLTITGDTATGRQTDTIVLNGVAWVSGSVDFTRVYILELDLVTAGNVTVQDNLGGAVHIIPAGTLHEDNAVILNAQDEMVREGWIAGTDLPAGRYLAAFRIRDTNQVENDVEIQIWNFTDGDQRSEQNAVINTKATATYAYHCYFFDITDTDVTGTNTIRLQVKKDLIDGNEIYVDYFLIIPIGNGYDWPQDLAHGAIRGITQHPRLSER